MTQEHPIAPPSELIQQWIDEPQHMTEDQLGKCVTLISMDGARFQEIINKASQYSADQELEACIAWLEWQKLVRHENLTAYLRATRRPKPPSLKDEALAVLDDCADRLDAAHENVLRRALEALPNA